MPAKGHGTQETIRGRGPLLLLLSQGEKGLFISPPKLPAHSQTPPSVLRRLCGVYIQQH